MVVGTILIGFVTALFTFTYKLYISWQNRIELKTNSNAIVRQIVFDTERSRSVLAAGDTMLLLTRGNGDSLCYHWQTGTIYRDKTAMNSPEDSSFLNVQCTKVLDSQKLLHEKLAVHLYGKRKQLLYEISDTASIEPSARRIFELSGK
jgi:hypothetical protein